MILAFAIFEHSPMVAPSIRSVFLSLAITGPCLSPGQNTWQRTYGGFGADEGTSVVALPDSGFVFLGSTGSFGPGNGDVYAIRVDGGGHVIWSRAYGSTGVDRGADVAITDDAALYLAGTTYADPVQGYDGLLVRTDLEGEPFWQRAYGGDQWDLFNAVASVQDGAYAVGQTFSSGNNQGDAWVVRVNDLGDTLWTRIIGASGTAQATAVEATPDGGCVVVVDLTEQDDQDILLVRYSADGTMLWASPWGGTAVDMGRGVTRTNDGGFIVSGSTESVVAYRTMMLLKFDGNGVFQWSEVTYGEGTWEGHRVVELANGDLCVAGSTDAFGAGGRDAYMWHTTSLGDYVEGPTFGWLENEEVIDVVACVDGGYVMVGRTTSFGPGPQALLAIRHVGAPLSGGVIETLDPLLIPDGGSSSIGLHLFPNPARSGDAIAVRMSGRIIGPWTGALLDQQGRSVALWPAVAVEEPLVLPPLAPGTYVLQLDRVDGGRMSTRLCILP